MAGDVFWYTTNQEQMLNIHQVDDVATDFSSLQESRKAIMAQADWIIPGHGEMIQNIRK